jgi:hypothetical protein
MKRIFISYRRDDAAGYAGRIYDDLRRRRGTDSVFMDVTDIEPGQEWERVIEETVRHHDGMLVVIGPRWLERGASGQRRIDDPGDMHRAEIRAALRLKVSIVPVLVGGARMPTPAQLPPDIQGLLGRQWTELTDSRWDYDLSRLHRATRQARLLGNGAWLIGCGVGIAAIVLVVGGAVLLLAALPDTGASITPTPMTRPLATPTRGPTAPTGRATPPPPLVTSPPRATPTIEAGSRGLGISPLLTMFPPAPPATVNSGTWTFSHVITRNTCGTPNAVGSRVDLRFVLERGPESVVRGDFQLAPGDSFTFVDAVGARWGPFRMTIPHLLLTVPDDLHDHTHYTFEFTAVNRASNQMVYHRLPTALSPECWVESVAN